MRLHCEFGSSALFPTLALTLQRGKDGGPMTAPALRSLWSATTEEPALTRRRLQERRKLMSPSSAVGLRAFPPPHCTWPKKVHGFAFSKRRARLRCLRPQWRPSHSGSQIRSGRTSRHVWPRTRRADRRDRRGRR